MSLLLPLNPTPAYLSGEAHGTGSATGTLTTGSVTATLDLVREAVEPRRDLTGDEQGLLTVIATALQTILMTEYDLSATEAAPAAILVYLALRSALRCLDRPIV